MVTPLMKILIAVILLYLLITAFLKITTWTLRTIIVLLIIGIFVFGYTSVSEILITPPGEKLKEMAEGNVTEESLLEKLPELTDMEEEFTELEDLEKELEDDIIEINTTEDVLEEND